MTDRRSECVVLDRFVDGVRAGEGRALVVHGEPGVGKTVLLDYLTGRTAGCRVERAAGVQSEMELAFAGLHQLCAPVQLRTATMGLASAHILQGELSTAARLIEEVRLIAEATGAPDANATAALQLAAWRGREQEASELIEVAVREGTVRQQGYWVAQANGLAAMLYNGLGRYGAARDAAWEAWEHRPVALGVFLVPELAEAAAKTGDTSMVRVALEWLSERTQIMPTRWALGIEARVRALLSDGDAADKCYRESIEHLARTGVRAQLARSHLLYGEWLSRENRRLDARAQLRAAYDMLSGMGAEGFAERARRELLATGETVRKRSAETASELTAREAYIARLAVEGRTNTEIAAQLFLSSRTVEWHLRNTYGKLGVGSRRELRWALANLGEADTQA